MRVFVSYRREDSSAWAGRLRDALAARFGHDRVFQDVVAISPGDNFDAAIEAAIVQCDVALAVIGPRWLDAASQGGSEPRLADPDDYVRRELVAAFEHGHQVIPVLVGGARMPAAVALPSELRPLAQRQAVSLRDETWHADVDRLVDALDGNAPTKRRRRLVLALAALSVAAALVLVATRGEESRSDGGSGDATSTSGGSTTTFDPISAALPPCPSPLPPDWTDLRWRGETEPRPDDQWTFEVVGGGYRQAAGDTWEVVIRSLATSRISNASLIHYPFYLLVVDGAESRPPRCFTLIGGKTMLRPLGSSEAYVGFRVSAEPTGAVALDIGHSEAYRIDLIAMTG